MPSNARLTFPSTLSSRAKPRDPSSHCTNGDTSRNSPKLLTLAAAAYWPNNKRGMPHVWRFSRRGHHDSPHNRVWGRAPSPVRPSNARLVLCRTRTLNQPRSVKSTPSTMSNFITAILIGIAVPAALRWFYSISSRGSVQHSASDLVYPPSKVITALKGISFVISISLLCGAFLLRENVAGSIVVVVVGLAFFLMGLLCRSIPIVLSPDGIHGESKWGRTAFIPWTQVKELSFSTRNRITTVVGQDRTKIYHAGFHADPEGFRNEIKTRTGLPLKIIEPGTWKPRVRSE